MGIPTIIFNSSFVIYGTVTSNCKTYTWGLPKLSTGRRQWSGTACSTLMPHGTTQVPWKLSGIGATWLTWCWQGTGHVDAYMESTFKCSSQTMKHSGIGPIQGSLIMDMECLLGMNMSERFRTDTAWTRTGVSCFRAESCIGIGMASLKTVFPQTKFQTATNSQSNSSSLYLPEYADHGLQDYFNDGFRKCLSDVTGLEKSLGFHSEVFSSYIIQGVPRKRFDDQNTFEKQFRPLKGSSGEQHGKPVTHLLPVWGRPFF